MSRHDGKFNVVGVAVDAIDYEKAVEAILAAARRRQPMKISALAVHGVMTGAMDPVQRWRLNGFDLATPDGQPVRWALNLLYGLRLRERVYGPDLTLAVCRAAAREDLPVYFYGSRPEIVRDLVARLSADIPHLRVAGTRSSLFRKATGAEKAEIVQEIRSSGAAIVFVGLGCPRQEIFVHEYADLVGLPMLAVGAAFDFHAGHSKQAPRLMQDNGLEWVFRLVQEPRRLWRRYLILNSYFVLLLALQWLGLSRFADQGTEPREEVGYA